MWEPSQPVQDRRRDRFRPPHCPWPQCADHTLHNRAYAFKREGHYRRKRDPQRRIPRFRCRRCRRTFARDAFATTYGLKRPELLLPVASLLVSGCAHRQIARHLDCAPSTVTRLSVRIGRHAQVFQKLLLARATPIREPIVLDHFETFVRSQQERFGIATAVGQQSWLVYGLSGAAHLRLTGRSRRKTVPKRAPQAVPPGAVVRSTLEILGNLLAHAPAGLDLVSDDHPAYRGALSRLRRAGRTSIRHTVYANPDRSPGCDPAAARARDRAMFAVDLLHKLLRHSQAHHRRETIAFGRRRSRVLGRAALFMAWRNLIKLVTERRPTRWTPAMRLGLTRTRWRWADVFAERLFERRIA